MLFKEWQASIEFSVIFMLNGPGQHYRLAINSYEWIYEIIEKCIMWASVLAYFNCRNYNKNNRISFYNMECLGRKSMYIN